MAGTKMGLDIMTLLGEKPSLVKSVTSMESLPTSNALWAMVSGGKATFPVKY